MLPVHHGVRADVLCGIGERPNDWRQLCDNLASSLDEYSDTLMIHLGEFDGIDDIEGAPIIRGSCISSLAHLAALYHFVGEMQPSARDMMNGLCDAALDNLSSLTKDLRLEEVTYFDLLLKVSNPLVLHTQEQIS